MLRRLLLGLALCGVLQAAALAGVDLTVAPAWKGWTRPGRATEIDVRLGADAASQASLALVAGRQSVHTELELQPGRPVRLQVPVPVPSSGPVGVRVAASPAGPALQQDVRLSLSESPLLGSALATGAAVELDGFHTLALAADDLPRNASAYSSVDALILDAPTLGALDRRQLGALLAHTAGCGRVVVVNPDARVRSLLAGAGGCGGRALMLAQTPADAKDLLTASLATGLPSAIRSGGMGELMQPAPGLWQQVATGLALYLAAAALAMLFFPSAPVLLMVPAVAAAAALALLHLVPASSQLLVWSEGESGVPVARYQAWQQFPGALRQTARVAVAPQLASFAQPCEPGQAMRFDFDPGRGQATFAAFDTRLFQQVSLCFSGSFPVARTIAIDQRADGQRAVRNAGAKAWPAGLLLDGGRVHGLPALGPGASTPLVATAAQPPRAALLRTARTRLSGEAAAALWPLDLGGVAGAPVQSTGWLLVTLPVP